MPPSRKGAVETLRGRIVAGVLLEKCDFDWIGDGFAGRVIHGVQHGLPHLLLRRFRSGAPTTHKPERQYGTQHKVINRILGVNQRRAKPQLYCRNRPRAATKTQQFLDVFCNVSPATHRRQTVHRCFLSCNLQIRVPRFDRLLVRQLQDAVPIPGGTRLCCAMTTPRKSWARYRRRAYGGDNGRRLPSGRQ